MNENNLNVSELDVPICKAGTCSIGLTSRYSLQCCSPPDLIRLIALISYGISLRFNAIRTRHEHELLQYEYKTGCEEEDVEHSVLDIFDQSTIVG